MQVTVNKYYNPPRPCYYREHKAFFHMWYDKETAILCFEDYFNSSDRQKIQDLYLEKGYLPRGVHIHILTAKLALVELESGEIKEALPFELRFIDTAQQLAQIAFDEEREAKT